MDCNSSLNKPNEERIRSKRPPQLRKFNLNSSETVCSNQTHAANSIDRHTSFSYNGQMLNIDPADCEVIQILGRGAYGIVEHVRHRPSGAELALKVSLFIHFLASF